MLVDGGFESTWSRFVCFSKGHRKMDHSHEPFTMLGASCRMTGSYFRDPQQNFPFLDGFRTMFGRAAYGLHQGISHMLIKSLYLLLKSHLCVHKDPFFLSPSIFRYFRFYTFDPPCLAISQAARQEAELQDS